VRRYVAGEDDGQKDQASVDKERIKILKSFERQIEKMSKKLKNMESSPPIELIKGRWEQMGQFLAASEVWKEAADQ
jgi:hypothetical protein